MTLLGDRAWWLPGWLDRVLPRLELEGSEDQAASTPDADAGEERRARHAPLPPPQPAPAEGEG